MTGTRQTGDQGFRKTKAAHEGHGAVILRLVEQHAPAVVSPKRTLKAQRLFDIFSKDGKVLD